MAVCLMPNDRPSLALSLSLRPDALVLSPASFVEDDFVDAVGASGVPLILRIGGATLGEIEATIGRLRDAGARDLLLLHGFQTYPTRLEETALRVMPVLSQMFDCAVGLADHLDGADPLAITIPALAVAVGAVALEKHITWDRAERGEDFESALDPLQFASFVGYVRQAETALGTTAMPRFGPDVLRYRQIVRKRVVAAGDLPEGTVLGPHHLACKRSDEGSEAGQRASLIGRRLRQAVRRDAPITAALVE
jgi:sialic acid synthase SpsE